MTEPLPEPSMRHVYRESLTGKRTLGPPPPKAPIDLSHGTYCRECGAKLIPNPKHYKFNEYDGTPVIHDFGKCPNKRWWKILGHHA